MKGKGIMVANKDWYDGYERTFGKKKCPTCGGTVHIMHGCGWDYDRLLCAERGCRWEKELDTISYPEGE